jgi:hypothetical protein
MKPLTLSLHVNTAELRARVALLQAALGDRKIGKRRQKAVLRALLAGLLTVERGHADA